MRKRRFRIIYFLANDDRQTERSHTVNSEYEMKRFATQSVKDHIALKPNARVIIRIEKVS